MDPTQGSTPLICPLTAADPQVMRAQMRQARDQGAEMVECRLDMLAEPPDERTLRMLLTDAPLPVIATNRAQHQGGRFPGDERRRLEVLRTAAKLGADYVDIEMDADADGLPPERTLLSHHDFSCCPDDLDEICRKLQASPAAVGKIAFAAGSCEDALRALDVLRGSAKPMISLAMAESGLLSRLLARKLGAFGTFASLAEGAESAPGQPTLEQFVQRYRWRAQGPDTRVYGVIGFPVGHSMSPDILNAAFDAAGHDGTYVPLLVRPGYETLERLLDAIRSRPWLDWRGLSVTLPHKENALAYVGPANCDELTLQIGAANTITFDEDGSIRATNTDYAAALDALCGAMEITREDLAGTRVGIIGAGGVARAIVAGLAHYGAEVTVYNRTVIRAHQLAAEFSCMHGGLDEAERASAEVIVNCTPLGMHPEPNATPLRRIPPSTRTVFDTIYNPIRTKLLRQAAEAGCRTVTGVDMFVNQAAAQYEVWTGKPAPREVMRDVVLEQLGAEPLE